MSSRKAGLGVEQTNELNHRVQRYPRYLLSIAFASIRRENLRIPYMYEVFLGRKLRAHCALVVCRKFLLHDEAPRTLRSFMQTNEVSQFRMSVDCILRVITC